MANRHLLVPSSAIDGPMTDEQIARCQEIVTSMTSLYASTKDALVVVADLGRNKAIPLYQHLLDDAVIRDHLPVYRATLSTEEARALDFEMGTLYDVVGAALDIYLGFEQE